jgi:hypothetical protein
MYKTGDLKIYKIYSSDTGLNYHRKELPNFNLYLTPGTTNIIKLTYLTFTNGVGKTNKRSPYREAVALTNPHTYTYTFRAHTFQILQLNWLRTLLQIQK